MRGCVPIDPEISRLPSRPPDVGLEVALRTGLYPFLPADLVKLLIAATILPTIWRFTRQGH